MPREGELTVSQKYQTISAINPASLGSLQEAKQPGSKASHYPPPDAEVRKRWSHTLHISHAFIAWTGIHLPFYLRKAKHEFFRLLGYDEA
jgi:hypothetical protein